MSEFRNYRATILKRIRLTIEFDGEVDATPEMLDRYAVEAMDDLEESQKYDEDGYNREEYPFAWDSVGRIKVVSIVPVEDNDNGDDGQPNEERGWRDFDPEC